MLQIVFIHSPGKYRFAILRLVCMQVVGVVDVEASNVDVSAALRQAIRDPVYPLPRRC